MVLRDYQLDLVERTRELLRRSVRSVLIQAPTGSGKTLLVAFMLKQAAARRLRSIFCVHRRELVQQTIHAFTEAGVSAGVIAAGWPSAPRELVQIGSIPTLVRRRDMAAPHLVVIDEVHHACSASWASLLTRYEAATRIGLTATPERLDGRGLSQWFEAMVRGPSTQTLISQGWLSPYRLFAPSTVSLDGVRTVAGDYATNDVTNALDTPTITGCAIQHYRRLAEGKRALVFCASIRHSLHTVQQFQSAGIPAAHFDGDTARDARDASVRRFASGDIRVLSNVALISEGFDLPAMEAVILLRPTKSLGLYLQMCGRVLRPSPGKTALILDHVGNAARHGLPDDPREWSLAGRERRTTPTESAPKVFTCPACFSAQPADTTRCRSCGYVKDASPREVEQVDGELTEVDLETARRVRRREQGRAQSFEALVALGHSRGYRNPSGWAAMVLRARNARSPVTV